MNEISVDELKKLIDSKTKLTILDVREESELNKGIIRGSIWVPMGQIPDRLAELPKKDKIVVYCRSGGRSGRIAEFLEHQGFVDVSNLDGGILAWKKIDPKIIAY